MHTMCIACGSQLLNEGSESTCKCLQMSLGTEKVNDSLFPHVEIPNKFYESYSENQAKDSVRMDDSSLYVTPLLSPLSGYESCSSSFGDSQFYMNQHSRKNTFHSLDYYQQHGNGRSEDHLEELGNGTSFLKLNIEQSCDKFCRDGSALYKIQENNSSSSALAFERISIRGINIENFHDNKDGSDAHVGLENNMSLSSLTVYSDENPYEKKGSENHTLVAHLLKSSNHCAQNIMDFDIPTLPNFEADPLIWKLPEPENPEDDNNSIAYKYEDDDDDYGDGTKWGQPSSLNTEEHRCLDDFKKERRKAMLEAINGQLKILVSRFLATEGISISTQEGLKNWLDIVTSLSWEAAVLVQPDANEGRGMDPSSYIKVKCVASGKPHESQVIKGLVFKKNTAHKHMPTNFKNPKLLLLEGALGQSAAALSSFDFMDQENHHLKSITKMIEICHPNVVMVEKSVPRDIQESLLGKEITLVFEMKRHRLERIARCTGSPIISSTVIPEKLTLKQCESFHIEKFVEEHNNFAEGGKKPSKTLMFLEGFVKPLGCTILLKGANSDELKKIKHVLHYTVFAAYHLRLETSFFADQCAFFSDKDRTTSFCTKPPLSVTIDDVSTNLSIMQDTSTNTAATMLEVPVSVYNGSAKGLSPGGIVLSIMKPEGSLEFPGCEAGDISANSDQILGKSQIGNIVAPDSLEFKPASSYFGSSRSGLLSTSVEKSGIGDMRYKTGVGKSDDEAFITEEVPKQYATDKSEVQTALEPRSILVLVSTQCVTKQTFCVQSHFSRIIYYGNLDVSLGQFLKTNVLNKEHICPSCGEPPEAHIYSYTHQNGNLSMFVKRHSDGVALSGENDGKLWMWTRCLRCDHESGIPRSTKRVLLSTSARKLSFGKFLELSFSGHSAASRLSKCRHPLFRDCLRFFGLGSMVAMFKYSPVEIYAACKPPPVLQFENPKTQGWLKDEVGNVHAMGQTFFAEVANILQKLKFTLSNKKIPVSGSVIDFSALEGMLLQEKADFENSLLKTIDGDGQKGMNVYEILGLRWFNQELLLELYIWDHRVCQLLHSNEFGTEDSFSHANEVNSNTDSKSWKNYWHHETSSSLDNNGTRDMQIDLDTQSVISANVAERPHDLLNVNDMEIPVQNFSGRPLDAKNVMGLADQHVGGEPDHYLRKSNMTVVSEENAVLDNKMMDQYIPTVKTEILEKENALEVRTGDESVNVIGKSNESDLNQNSSVVENKSHTKSEDPQTLIWAPFSELRKELKKDLFGGSLQNLGFINNYIPSHLSPITQPLSLQLDLLHFAFGPGGNILTACEDEISSIIACALAISEYKQGLWGAFDNEFGEPKAVKHKSSRSLSSDFVFSGSLSFRGSERVNLFHSASASSDELSSLCIDGSLSAGQLLSSHNLHPEIPIGTSKLAGKSKCSVICIHAKQFYNLRKKCCPSEAAYISSLSRCRKWDAQGGKSKALFAKTLDDRFIIKQIKKTELDSFLKFAPGYFKHVSHSLDSGSQTCLAKILGIYQVRQIKNGKEIKIDLLVMENLVFGHNILRMYDLKGALFSRYTPASNDTNKVLLDQNFIEDMRVSPIYIGRKTKHLLQRAIWNDTSFLNNVNVMDYSLLVGVDRQRRELVFGIIDYLRQYTWDKQLETWVKSSIVVPKNELPTIISPKEYKKRFRKFMAKYFLTVPDSWERGRCSFPCKFHTNGRNGSAKIHNAELPEQQIEAAYT